MPLESEPPPAQTTLRVASRPATSQGLGRPKYSSLKRPGADAAYPLAIQEVGFAGAGLFAAAEAFALEGQRLLAAGYLVLQVP